jgi:AraC-like DNA-binding protein
LAAVGTGRLSCASRTFGLLLGACGTRFEVRGNEVPFHTARRMLAGSSMDITRITNALDHADPGAFTPAVRRRSGTTPARWRAQPAAAAQFCPLINVKALPRHGLARQSARHNDGAPR